VPTHCRSAAGYRCTAGPPTLPWARSSSCRSTFAITSTCPWLSVRACHCCCCCPWTCPCVPSPLALPLYGLAHAPALAPGPAPADAPALPLLSYLLCMTADLPSVLAVHLLSFKYNGHCTHVQTTAGLFAACTHSRWNSCLSLLAS